MKSLYASLARVICFFLSKETVSTSKTRGHEVDESLVGARCKIRQIYRVVVAEFYGVKCDFGRLYTIGSIIQS